MRSNKVPLAFQRGSGSSRRLRVAISPFETAYEYELAKLPHDIILLGNTHRDWDVTARPLRASMRVAYSLADADADVLVLGVDQQTFETVSDRMLFIGLRDRFAGPKIIVNHGCNLVDGCSSAEMRQLVQDNLMVCASTTAMNLWQVARARVLRRGLTPSEWPASNYGRGNIVAIEPDDRLDYYNAQALTRLNQRGIKVSWITGGRRFNSFDTYRAFLASSAVFFNPSYAAPNLRAMVEAQLCGLAVVTTNSHGESHYIRNGENGFASNNMEELHGFVEYLVRNPREAQRVGSNGRKMAQRLFNAERFLADWGGLIVEVVGLPAPALGT